MLLNQQPASVIACGPRLVLADASGHSPLLGGCNQVVLRRGRLVPCMRLAYLHFLHSFQLATKIKLACAQLRDYNLS